MSANDMTSSEEIILYAYLNIDHPMVAWEVAIGRIKSVVDITPEEFGISLWQYSRLRKFATYGADRQFINEFYLDSVRQKQYPNKVSRLQGLYFFEKEKDALVALNRWRVPVNKKYISAVKFTPSRLTRVDSEWITKYLNSEIDREWMQNYWKGETLGNKPLTEILAMGIGVVMNYELRVEAYKKIMALWPTSTPLLSMACCAFQAKGIDSVALTKPALIKDKEKLKGRLYIYMLDFETKKDLIIEAISICRNQGIMPQFILPANPDVFFTLPDNKNLGFEFSNLEANRIFKDIHHS